VKRVFISRSLAVDSPIRGVIAEYKSRYSEREDVELVAESLITFTKVAWEVPMTRWLFFYSKTGVRMFNEVCSSHHYKVLTYGGATADYHRTYNGGYGPVVDHGGADTEQALALLELYDCGEDITFVCGRQSLRSVHEHSSVKSDHFRECIVYDQHLREDIIPSSYDLAVITSPLNYSAWANAGSRAETFVAIGATTAAVLEEHGENVIVADAPSEAGIAATVGRWLAR